MLGTHPRSLSTYLYIYIHTVIDFLNVLPYCLCCTEVILLHVPWVVSSTRSDAYLGFLGRVLD